MPVFFFDFRAGDRLYRDRLGVEFGTSGEAREGLQEALIEAARCDSPLLEEYEIVLRQEMRPIFRVRLRFSAEDIN